MTSLHRRRSDTIARPTSTLRPVTLFRRRRAGYGILYSPDIIGQQPLTINPPNGSRYDCSLSTYGTSSCPQVPAQVNLDTGYPFPPLLPPSTKPFPAPTSG